MILADTEVAIAIPGMDDFPRASSMILNALRLAFALAEIGLGAGAAWVADRLGRRGGSRLGCTVTLDCVVGGLLGDDVLLLRLGMKRRIVL